MCVRVQRLAGNASGHQQVNVTHFVIKAEVVDECCRLHLSHSLRLNRIRAHCFTESPSFLFFDVSIPRGWSSTCRRGCIWGKRREHNTGRGPPRVSSSFNSNSALVIAVACSNRMQLRRVGLRPEWDSSRHAALTVRRALAEHNLPGYHQPTRPYLHQRPSERWLQGLSAKFA